MKKFGSLFCLLFIINFPMACDDGCGGFGGSATSILDLEALTGSYNNDVFRNKVSTDFETAAIQVYISDLELLSASNYLKSPFITSAYACSPIPPDPQEVIAGITISSPESVTFGGQEYMSGESLNALFQVASYGNSTIEEYIAAQEDNPLFAGLQSFFVLTLVDNPYTQISQDFNIVVELSDGRQFDLLVTDFEVIP